jgi:peptidyl-prolyl cis-trans isomerase A (cyclophilin A)
MTTRGLLLLFGLAGCEPSPTPSPDTDAPTDDILSEGEVVFATTLGAIHLQLDPSAAPVTCTNFLGYVDAGFYDGDDGAQPTVFHRIVPGFVIQGGGLTEALQRKDTQSAIPNESDNGRRNTRGTLSMARLNDPDSATSQFFINLVDNPFLDATPGNTDGYAVFADVVIGMDVVDAIAAVRTQTTGQFSDVPVEPVVVLDVTRGPRGDAP